MLELTSFYTPTEVKKFKVPTEVSFTNEHLENVCINRINRREKYQYECQWSVLNYYSSQASFYTGM